jgi:hypothetical protein
LTAEEARMIADGGYEQAVYAEIDKVLRQVKEFAKTGLYEIILNRELYKETITTLKELGYKIKVRDRFHCYSKTIISWKKGE